MSNPWNDIDLTAYENHMSLEHVYQLQTMNEMMKEQFDSYPVETVMILGIAGGNGLEHIAPHQFHSVYGVDINPDYLNECRQRYPVLADTLHLICADLLDENVRLPRAELLVANLLVEYIGYECFQKIVKLVNPQVVSCVIQINTETSFVSDSPYLHVFDRLEEVHHQMEERALVDCLLEIGYTQKQVKNKALPNGKKLVQLDFIH